MKNWIERPCRSYTMYIAPSPGGGGYFHYWRWVGTCRWTGYDFHGHQYWHIGYLNRPNWLLVGYSVYHRVASPARASQPTVHVYDRPAISAPAMVRAGRNRFRVFISFYCKTTIRHGYIIYPRCAILQQGMHMKDFSKVYIVTGCIFCAPSGLRQGQVLTRAPPPPPWAPSPCMLRRLLLLR